MGDSRASGREDDQPGRAARRAAAALLGRVLDRGQPLSELTAPGGALDRLAPAARAQAQRLALAALRNLARADATLAPLLRKAPPAPVRHLLRLATVEHLAEGAPAHAVVNDAVALIGEGRRTAHLAGLANAVLRRALATPPEAWAALPPEPMPGWLRAPVAGAWGKAVAAAIEAAHLRGAPLDLTPRDPAAAAHWAEALGAEHLPTGSLRLRAGGQVSGLPGHAEGAWWVQDAAAALPARLLAARPGERVLDLCAAPGGKTLQLAAAGATVTALDISAPRLGRLRENLGRTGLAAEVVAADALHWAPPAPFDAILLDAPCTATGTIRRHPDLPHCRDGAALAGLVALQAALIDRALGWLRPAGRLVYATCSLLADEGEAQIAAALARHPGLAVDPAAADRVSGLEAAWRRADGSLRLRPDHWAERGGIDGFFIACLHRPGGEGGDSTGASG